MVVTDRRLFWTERPLDVELQEKLRCFFAKHKPGDLGQVDRFVREYSQQQEQLNDMLRSKFGEDLSTTNLATETELAAADNRPDSLEDIQHLGASKDENQGNPIVLEVVRATQLPANSELYSPAAEPAAARSKLNPYARIQLVNLVATSLPEGGLKIHKESRRMGQGRTQSRSECSVPEWHNYVELGCASADASTAENDYLLIEIFDSVLESAGRDRFSDYRIAAGRIRLREIPADNRLHHIFLTRVEDSETDPFPPCTESDGPSANGLEKPCVQLRRLSSDIPRKSRLKVFLVRHGESEWNEAKATNNFYTMAKSFDHPLNSVGVKQAEAIHAAWTTQQSEPEPAPEPESASIPSETALKSDDHAYIKRLRSARRIYSSPLTRALQTAMIGFLGHPCLQSDESAGICLLCSAREVKTLGGFDTVGIETGEGVKKRACEQSNRHLPLDKAAQLKEINIDTGEVMTKWWTSVKDTNATISHRIEELLLRLRYDAAQDRYSDSDSSNQSVIVVAHSLIIREIFRRCTVPNSTFSRSALAAQLAQNKITNGGVVALEIEFFDQTVPFAERPLSMFATDDSRVLASILQAELLFGTTVVQGSTLSVRPEFVEVPLHAVTKIEADGGGVGLGLVSTFKLAIQHTSIAAQDESGEVVPAGKVLLEFGHKSERDEISAQLMKACSEQQRLNFESSLGMDEDIVITVACESLVPSKAAHGPLIAGVSGGSGGTIHLTNQRLIWCPRVHCLHGALGHESKPVKTGDPIVLSIPLNAIAFVEILSVSLLSSTLNWRVKLRGGGDEYLKIQFAPELQKTIRTMHERTLDLLREILDREILENPKSYAKLHVGWLEKLQPHGLLWQRRWFVLTPLALRYYSVIPGEDSTEQINANGELALQDVDAAGPSVQDDRRFDLKLKDEAGRPPYFLRAVSQKDAETWLSKITAARSQLE